MVLPFLAIAGVALSQSSAAVSAPTSAPSEIALKKVYKLHERDTFSMTVEISAMGDAQSWSGDLTAVVQKLHGDKAAEVELFTRNTKGDVFGPGSSEIPSWTSRFDQHGMAEDLRVQGPDVIYTIYCLNSFLPALNVKVGEEYKVAFKSESIKVDGKGKIKEVRRKEDGSDVAIVESTFSVSPENLDAAEITIKQEIDIASGKTLKAESEAVLPDGTRFKVKLNLKPKAA